MFGKFSVTSFKALVAIVFESKSGTVVTSRLLGVSHPECNMIEGMEDSNLWSHSWFLVVHLSFLIKEYLIIIIINQKKVYIVTQNI